MSTKTKSVKTGLNPQPVASIQVGGVRIPIWKNEGRDGIYFKAGEPTLSYKSDDGTWKEAASFGGRDLVNLIEAAALAHSELVKLNRAAKAEKPATAADLEE